MPVYLLFGFRWPRAGFTGIRVYIVLHNLENATAEYLQQPHTEHLMIESLKKNESDIMARISELRFIEQYDPDDTTSETAVSQSHAYVAGRVIEIPDPSSPGSIGWDTEDLGSKPGLPEPALGALTELRDKLAAGERIGWWIVYNGDPERYFPESDVESLDEDEMMANDEYHGGDRFKEEPQRPQTASIPNFSAKLTRLFKRNSNNSA